MLWSRMCIWKYHFIALFFFYESIFLKKEHLKLMHLFLANQGQKSFFLWSVKRLYIFYSPFIKRKRSSKFPIGSARHFFNVFAQWCLEIMYRLVANFFWMIIKVHIFWEGHKILRNIHLTFDWHYIGKK